MTCLRGPSPRHCAQATQVPFEEILQRWRAVVNTVSNLTGPRFEPQTSHSRDGRVTARFKEDIEQSDSTMKTAITELQYRTLSFCLLE